MKSCKRLITISFFMFLLFTACGNTYSFEESSAKIKNDGVNEQSLEVSVNPQWQTKPSKLFVKYYPYMASQIDVMDVASAKKYLAEKKVKYEIIETSLITTIDIHDEENGNILTLSFTKYGDKKQVLEIVKYGNSEMSIDVVDLNHMNNIQFKANTFLGEQTKIMDKMSDLLDFFFGEQNYNDNSF